MGCIPQPSGTAGRFFLRPLGLGTGPLAEMPICLRTRGMPFWVRSLPCVHFPGTAEPRASRSEFGKLRPVPPTVLGLRDPSSQLLGVTAAESSQLSPNLGATLSLIQALSQSHVASRIRGGEITRWGGIQAWLALSQSGTTLQGPPSSRAPQRVC